MKTYMLIDGDMLVYRAGWSVEKRQYTHKDLPGEFFGTMKEAVQVCVDRLGVTEEDAKSSLFLETAAEPLSYAIHSMREFLNSIVSYEEGAVPLVFLSCPGEQNLRKKLYPSYKGNRDASAKPYWYDDLRSYLKSKHAAVELEGLEADDCLGWLQRSYPLCKTVIVSNDKDFRTVPGTIYDPTVQKVTEITPAEARRNFFKQLLMGDMVDNIPGIPGVGERKAEEILNTYDKPWDYLPKMGRRFGQPGTWYYGTQDEEGVTKLILDSYTKLYFPKLLHDNGWPVDKTEILQQYHDMLFYIGQQYYCLKIPNPVVGGKYGVDMAWADAQAFNDYTLEMYKRLEELEDLFLPLLEGEEDE